MLPALTLTLHARLATWLQKQRLRTIFLRYCAWCARTNFMFMDRSQWLRCARDAGLAAGHVDTTQLSLLYDKVVCDMAESSTGKRLSLVAFTQVVAAAAAFAYSEHSKQQAFDTVVSEHFAPLEAMAPPDDDPASDPLALVLLSSEVVDGLAAAAPRLRYIYDFYLQEQELGDSQIEWSKLLDVKSKMPLPAFSQFCTDFEIVPQLVSRIKATEAFKLCKFKAEKEAGTINTRISFQEWCDCLGRCALLAYGWHEEVVSVSGMEFRDAYQTAAKQLWQRVDSSASAAASSSGVGLPPAESVRPPASASAAAAEEDAWLDALEAQDRGSSLGAHQQASTSGRSLMPPPTAGASEDLISRAVSIKQRATHTQLPGGGECMQIHAEPCALVRGADQQRPHHLTAFTVDWHARPGMPLSETGRLRLSQARSAGSPHGTHSRAALQMQRPAGPSQPHLAREGEGAWLPPQGAPRPFGSPAYLTSPPSAPLNKYQEAAQGMLDARVVREQHVEGMRLAYQVERRQEQRAKDVYRTMQRQHLELSSGQTIAKSKGADTWPAAPSMGASFTSGGGTRPLLDELLQPAHVLESLS